MANTPAGAAAPLSQIFQYYGRNSNEQLSPFRNARNGETGSYNGPGDWEFYRDGGGESGIFNEGWRVRQGSFLDQMNQKYNLNAQVVKNNDQYDAKFNFENMPRTRFGSLDKVQGTDEQGSNLVNPNLKYYDENYGWVTPASNFKRPNAWLGPALMAIVGAGMGGLGGGMGTARSALQGLQGAFKGNFNPMQLASLVMGGGNIPGMDMLNSPWGRIAAQLGQAARSRKPRGG